MDLMDDLLRSEDQPEQPDSEEQSSDLGEWDELLSTADFDEPIEQESGGGGFLSNLLSRFRRDKTPAEDSAPEEQAEQPRKARSGRGGFSRGQKIVLGILFVMVLGVYAGLIFIVVQSMRSSNVPASPAENGGDLVVITPAGTAVDWTGEGGSTSSPLITETVSLTPTLSSEAAGEPEGEPGPTETLIPTLTPTPQAVPTQFDTEVSRDPDNVELRLQRAAVYMEFAAYEAAVRDFEHVLSLEPEYAEAYVGLGEAYFYLRRWNEAEAAYSSAVSFNEDLPAAHFGLARLYYYRARYTDAAQAFDWAAEINPDFVEAECWLSIASARAGDAQEALAASGRAYSITQELPLVYIARSWAFRIQEPPDLDGAQGDLLYAQELDPYSFEVQKALARFYTDYRPERLAEAEQLAQYAVNWAETDLERALGLHELGRVYLAQDRKEDARKVLSEAADLAMADGRVAITELAQDLEKTFAP